MAKRVILSGMRPTGKLHVGNFLGALSNWIQLENSPETQCFYMVADWHALTTDYQDPSQAESLIEEMVLDWIAAGLDPEKSVIFRQSWVKEHSELALILSMITPISWLERNPTYKEQVSELKDREISTHGFLGYPVLQAADILLYGATHVPVGEDQLPHLELTREIARRFNFLYKKPVFTEPQAILSPAPKVRGTDGRKMSKSYDNCVYLSESPVSLKKKIQLMYTDPLKIRADSHGHPVACPENPPGCAVFSLHQLYEGDPKKNEQREKACKDGTLGCVPCKQDLSNEMAEPFNRHRERRDQLSQNRSFVKDLLKKGTETARIHAQKTLRNVRQSIGYHELV